MRREWTVEVGLLDSSGNELKAPGYAPIMVTFVEWQGTARLETSAVFRDAVGPAWGTLGGWRIARWRVPFRQPVIVTEHMSVQLDGLEVPGRSLEDFEPK